MHGELLVDRFCCVVIAWRYHIINIIIDRLQLILYYSCSIIGYIVYVVLIAKAA